MLGQVGFLPQESQGGFYDYLTGSIITSLQGKLVKIEPNCEPAELSIGLSTSSLYSSPENYLQPLIRVSGSILFNSELTMATNKSIEPCIVRSKRSIRDRASWQFHVPGSLYGVELGVVNIAPNGAIKYLPFTFNASTSRTVTFVIDNLSIQAWVNDTSGKKNKKSLEWDLETTFPYAKIPTQGASIIFNPFSVQPNEKISHTNPFNTNKVAEIPPSLEEITEISTENPKICEVKQIDKDRLLLISESGHVKLIIRNSENNLVEISNVVMNEDKVRGLFELKEWLLVSELFEEHNLPSFNSQAFYRTSDLLNLLKVLIIKIDQHEALHSHQSFYTVKHILLSKLSIIRPYVSSFIPNSISCCEIDLYQHHHTGQFFKNTNTLPLRTVSTAVVQNSIPWTKLEGRFVQVTKNYLCSVREGQNQDAEISIYHINDFGIIKVLTAHATGNKLDFENPKSLERSPDFEVNLWKENTQGAEIYKILSNCFNQPGLGDINVLEPKEKDIKELVEIFKIPKEEAITSLEQCENVEDALAWLADSNHKILRKRKVLPEAEGEEKAKQSQLIISMLELPEKNIVSKLLLLLNNSIYVIGFNPQTVANSYVLKVEKGFLNLSSFEYGMSLSEINSSHVHKGCNHNSLVILDELELNSHIKSEALFLFKKNHGIFLAHNNGNTIYESEIEFSEENVYKDNVSLKLKEEKESIYKEVTLKSTNNQEKYNPGSEEVYEEESFVIENSKIYSNVEVSNQDELLRTAEVWLKFKQPQLTFSEVDDADSKFLPLLVERGPPGCNMNYPICSILYPKASLPFLANYPYSLTFKHLHSKCMKVTEVIIQRIGDKQNVNEIKEGSIYFIDDSNVQSKRYSFTFEQKNELTVSINEENYWRYMVIEPTYNSGSKLPYEIGFMGAKGHSIENEEYLDAVREFVEDNLEGKNENIPVLLTLKRLENLSHSCYKAVVSYKQNKDGKNNLEIFSKSNDLRLIMLNLKTVEREQTAENKESNSADLRPNQIALLSPTEVIEYLNKHVSNTKEGKTSLNDLILSEIGKNLNSNFKDYDDNQIKIFVDLFISTQGLSVKEFNHIYQRIENESNEGAKYLHQLIRNLGKGDDLLIDPKYMPFILNKALSQEQSNFEVILRDLLVNANKLRNPQYDTLRQLYSSPYLLLESDYYSKNYYNQVRAIDLGATEGKVCDKIFKEDILGFQFAVIKESKVRKIIVKLNKKSSIKNIILRFDKSEAQNRAFINVYSWTANIKTACANTLLYDHQWIQMTKNPYRKEMITMFGSNHSLLNAYGISFDERVEASYLEIEVILNFSSISQSDNINQGTIEIVPEIYGMDIGTAEPVLHLEDSYFKFSEDEKIFLARNPLKLQICSETNDDSRLFNKYLINKQNMIEYNLYEFEDSEGDKGEIYFDELAVEYNNAVQNLTKITSAVEQGTAVHKNDKTELIPILAQYENIMKNLSNKNSGIKISRKISLDYCYTLIVWILEMQSKKDFFIHESLAELLLNEIVKKETGPVSFACLKVLFDHPRLLVEGLKYIQITNKDEVQSFIEISTSALKSSTVKIEQESIKKALEEKNAKIVESLLNIIMDTKTPSEQSILQCIDLAPLANKNEQIINYIINSRNSENTENQLIFGNKSKEELDNKIINFVYSEPITKELRNNKFIEKLNGSELERFILTVKKISTEKSESLDVDFSYLLYQLLNEKNVKSVSLDIVSLIFELNLPADEQWDFLEKCIKLCHTTEDMIHLRYLSSGREQKEELLQLATFHRDILLSAAKLEKNSELLVNFLGELFYCHKDLFIQIVLSLPEGEVADLHPDIYSIAFRILEDECNFGGVEGAKSVTFGENLWLAVVTKLFKLCSSELDERSLSSAEVEGIVRWYLLNNEYEEHLSNPINRSQSVTNLKIAAERVANAINWIGGAKNINKIFNMCTEIKDDIKKDSKRLHSTKHLILNRLQYGVCKLMETNLDTQSLTEVLIGGEKSKGIIEEIIDELEQEEKKLSHQKDESSESEKPTDLTEELKVYSAQGSSVSPLACKDLQTYKTGSKQSIFSISAGNKKILLKSENNLNISKFIIGFIVQESNEKNIILPDAVELYGGEVDKVENAHTRSLRKICDLHVIDDQNYSQLGIKLFGVNFDCIKRQYRNQPCNLLEVRVKSFVLPSSSDILEGGQKASKNLVHQVNFIAIDGHKNYQEKELSFSNIYMKLLTFLNDPRYNSTLKALVKKLPANVINRLVEILNVKAQNKSKSNPHEIENLLISLNKNNFPILEFLLKKPEVNQQLVNKILKSNLETPNVDLVLSNALAQTLKPEIISNIIENIALNNLQPKPKTSKQGLSYIIEICNKYKRAVRNTSVSEKENPKSEVYLLQKVIICLAISKTYEFNAIELTKTLLNESNDTDLYPIIAGFAPNNSKILDWFLEEGRLDKICDRLLDEMSIYRDSKKKENENEVYNIITLISALSVYPPIKEKLSSNAENDKNKIFAIKAFKLLSNEETLIEQYQIPILSKFINLIQATCTDGGDNNLCSQEFAQNLIEVMVRLPNTSSVYHNYFIHEFFFPIINAYNGVVVNFLWKGINDQYLSKPTDILKELPIRKNKFIIQHQNVYFKLATTKEHILNNYKKIIYFDGRAIAEKTHIWELIKGIDTNEHQIREIIEEKEEIKLTTANGDTKLFDFVDEASPYKLYVADPEIYADLSKLLTNQTLLKVKNPLLFANKFKTNLPIASGMLPNVYLLPSEMTIEQLLNEVNINGYRLDSESKKNIKPILYSNGSLIELKEQLSNVFSKIVEKPMIDIEISANDLFRTTTIEKIANQTTETDKVKFIAQETIFKSFEKLQGLEKMIKVIIACVKNWKNEEQIKVWNQYLTELSSFSCFPIFSSIYMNEQENVELLFNLLLGLPDKEENTKWLEQEKKSVKFLYDIIKNVFEVEGDQAITVRNYAVQSGFFETMLERLHIISKEPKRHRNEEEEEEEIIAELELTKKTSEEEYKKEIKKKKGIGYGNDSSTNQKWDITGHEEARKELEEQIIGLIKILEKFLSYPQFKLPKEYLNSTYESSLLPILEASLRAGSLLEISKRSEMFKEELRFIRAIAKNELLVPVLLEIPKIYEPKQPESIFSLLTTLEGTSKIFLSCLNGEVSEKTSEEIAKEIIETFNLVEESIENYRNEHHDEEADKKILELPLAKKYPILMKDLRFDYVDMKDKTGKIKHHYNSSFQAKYTPAPTKAIRLAQELADISQALPIEHTNAIFVRCDKDRVDFMQAMIMGSNGTPYGHGAYLFDIYFDDTYPSNPPKVNLTTTGSGTIRFNPNLYNCGKVCLSLLGTWRGSAMENWDAKVSTLLQVLVSIQSIIMAEEVYFNEPGFEHEQGTVEGEKKNEAYSNIVRYGNVKFAMLENIKNPPKGFETIIRRHFYLKKDEILQECKKWVKYAEKREASYTGLVSDHNNNWCTTFKKSKTEYQTMLEKAINELEIELNKLPEPSAKDLIKEKKSPKKLNKKKEEMKVDKDEVLEEIDVTYDRNQTVQSNIIQKEIDINDEKVKDRWSRYIGAMGLEAVNKQSKASILMFGISSLGIEIAKNIVMSGCKRFTVCDPELTNWKDLSGQFYLSEEEINKGRVDSCLYKLQDLNNYVRVDSVSIDLTKLEEEGKLKDYQVIISTVHDEKELILIDSYCRKNDIKFIAAKCEGPYGYIFNDFGKMEVLDRNGEETVECFIESITNEEEGVVTLMPGQKHPYEDGEMVRITNIKGMQSKVDETKSINETVHKISIVNKSSFKIGNTTEYTEYIGNGLVRNLKIPVEVNFKSLEESITIPNIDANLEYYDFAKSVNNKTLHNCFRTLSEYKQQNKTVPKPWNWEDASMFFSMYESIVKVGDENVEISESEKKYIFKFSFTNSGSFAPLAAFYGGLVAQEAFKAITNKYMPINQFFITDFTEVIEELPKEFGEWKEFVDKKAYKPNEDRFEGIKRIIGEETLEKIRECNVFVIGSGAIGCELLKNYAMINLATSEKPNRGTIVVTDPDHIETSNLNRQFLFREKHLQKPKSATSAAVVRQMNKFLKGENKIKAKLIKVCEATKDTFSNEFFESMNIVTNALDNVQARQYVDLRCVENKVALLESGTLSTKGHVQVIIPFKTETYGSKADPAEEGDIPHCTLKMFPEETLHCVEWARDIFGKTFTMKPKALGKILENINEYNPSPSETAVLRDCLQMIEDKPNNFNDAVLIATNEFFKVFRNDIKQLLYTYPLDAKTKDGKDFWKLPKRPPTPIEEIDPQSKLQGEFITSYAVLLCKIFNIEYPKEFRTVECREQILREAMKIKVKPFVPSDKAAKEMATEVEESKNENKEEEIVEKNIEEESDYIELFNKIKEHINDEKENGKEIKVAAEEFEKDDDANGHIDLIYSMANLRATNYRLDPMDWITTKLKAGRITPALSTTTSSIAALQTIELIKYLKNLPIDQMKNTFLNLAVPIIQAGEPGEIEKIKIHEDLTTNIWERWVLDEINFNEIDMETLLRLIEEKYKIKVKTLNISGGGPIYSDLVLGLESKKSEKEAFMKRKFKEVLSEEIVVEELKNFVDLTLVMAVGEEFVKHVPTLRVNLQH